MIKIHFNVNVLGMNFKIATEEVFVSRKKLVISSIEL